MTAIDALIDMNRGSTCIVTRSAKKNSAVAISPVRTSHVPFDVSRFLVIISRARKLYNAYPTLPMIRRSMRVINGVEAHIMVATVYMI